MRTAAIVNLKGGVGKSTTAINMASNLVTIHNKKVLLVDDDIQANVSKFFGVHDYDYKSMEDILRESEIITEDIIRTTNRKGLDVIPANMNLDAAAVDLMLDKTQEQTAKLRNALLQVEHLYDYCIIDCPPGVGINVLNALAAANDIIIPIKVDKNALDGMEELVEVIEEMKTYNSGLELVKCLVTMFTKDIVTIKGEEALIASGYSTFSTHIRYSNKVNAWTFEEGKSLIETTPRSAATRDYKNLVLEYLDMTRKD
ncbi:MAG: ParA family protein [Lachnotalea sp.]